MLEFPRWKVWIVSLVVALGVLWSIPSLIAGTQLASRWPAWMPQSKINLGLDLAGGSHLLLEADQRDALKTRLQGKEDEVSTELRRNPKIDIGDISTSGGNLTFMVRDPTQVDAVVERLRRLSQPVALTGHEYRVLAYLMHHQGKVVSRAELTEHVYAQDADRDSNTIEVFVGRLRKKLGPDVIQTVRGLGYRLGEP